MRACVTRRITVLPRIAVFAAALLAALLPPPVAFAGGAHASVINAACSILPGRYIIEAVGGDLVSVTVLVGPGQSPHTFEPTPKQMAKLAEADVYFSMGLPMERGLLEPLRALNPDVVVSDITAGIERRRVDAGATGDSEHQGEHDHEAADHGLLDPHTWLDPELMIVQARNVCGVLKQLRPASSAALDANLAALESELAALDVELSEALAPLAGSSVYVFHPAFGYFTDAYGLRQIAVEVGGVEPSARELAALIARAKSEGVRVIFVQPQFSRSTAEAIAREIGGAVVAIDPLSPDYISNMRAIAHQVAAALGTGEKEGPK